MSKQQYQEGDTVEFMFQQRWNIERNGHKQPNVGTIIDVRGDNIIVKAGGGAWFHLSQEMVRRPGTGDE